MDLGQEDEGQQYLSKFQRIRPKKVRGPWKQAGMIESATLPAPERTRREIERLRQDARTHPDDPELQLHFASLLLADGRADEASVEFRLLLTRNAENRVWQEAGDLLAWVRAVSAGREFLERATAADRPLMWTLRLWFSLPKARPRRWTCLSECRMRTGAETICS